MYLLFKGWEQKDQQSRRRWSTYPTRRCTQEWRVGPQRRRRQSRRWLRLLRSKQQPQHYSLERISSATRLIYYDRYECTSLADSVSDGTALNDGCARDDEGERGENLWEEHGGRLGLVKAVGWKERVFSRFACIMISISFVQIAANHELHPMITHES